MKALIVLLATGTVMLAQTPAPTKSAAPAAKAPAAPAANPLLHPETLKAKAPDSFKVKFTTTHGDIVVAVHRDWSPLGADRFYNLVKAHFFTNVSFFRMAKGQTGLPFVAQFGIAPDPHVAAVWLNASIKDDPAKPTVHNTKGTVVFATSGPNSRTTQLFINQNNNTFLDASGFTPFGEVTEGLDVAMSLYDGYGERPDQSHIQAEGKAYLDKNFPKLDSIKSAVILPAEGAPATKSTAPAAAPKAATPAPATKK
jgi:peptidyl-prolyl cis-trans isomerase A (cyclophilin A)